MKHLCLNKMKKYIDLLKTIFTSFFLQKAPENVPVKPGDVIQAVTRASGSLCGGNLELDTEQLIIGCIFICAGFDINYIICTVIMVIHLVLTTIQKQFAYIKCKFE